ncbi:cellulase family glycosylhydrolase [Mycobacterium sp. 3519A]|uniref:cellulase family glycosylhydrolase n=1 Tax=Mycobacterium sp. 3519A TaxID=2057184 RepID=UPI001358104F|nr:cellulase family glycosylhydrolase [Mycobacterium sp. 3519A]
MRLSTRHTIRRYAIAAVIAVIPLAAMCAAMTYLLNPKPAPVALDVMPVVSIDQSSTTVGVADSDLYGRSNAEIIDSLNDMQALGVNTIRVLIPWGDIQKVPPGSPLEVLAPPDWSKVDFIVQQAVNRNMAVLGVLSATPYWGGQNGTGCIGCPGVAPDPTKFAAFAGLAAARYAGKVAAYEVWNEPNYIKSWLPTPDPVAYTNVLKAVYTAIKGDPNDPNDGADPNALVVGGVLGSVAGFAGITYDTVDFVRKMYANGAKGYFDALSYHPYNFKTKFSDGTYSIFKPWNKFSPLNQLLEIRQLMIANQDQALRIWASEFGLPTGGPNAVTEATQAAFIADFLDKWSSMSFTGPAFIYSLRDRLGAELTEQGSLGVFKYAADLNDWVMKAAAQVIKDFIDAHPADPTDPTDPPGPASPPNLVQQLTQALAALFHQVQATVQGLVGSVTGFVNAIAQAVARIFNPGGAALRTVPAALQDEVAGATSLAVTSAQSRAIAQDRSSPDPSPGTSPDTSPDTPVAAADDEKKVAAAEQTAAPESKTVDTDDVKSVNTDSTTASTDTGSDDLGDVAKVESREPVRTGLVARPTKLGSDRAVKPGKTTSDDEKASTPTTDTTDDSESSSESDASDES